MLEKAYLQSEKTGAEITVFNYEYYNTVSGKTTEPEDIKLYHLPKKETFNHKDMQKYILTDFCCAAWNKLYLRTFLEKHNLKFHEIQRFNDIYFTIYSLAVAEKITVLNIPLLYYRIGMRKNCQSTIERYPLDFYDTLKKLKEDLESSYLWDSLNQSYKNLAMAVCVTSIHQLNDKREHKQVYDFLKNVGFKELEIEDEYTSKNYYYNKIRHLEYLIISNLPYEKYNSKRGKILFYLSNIRLTFSSYINRIHRLLKRKGIRETISRIFTFIFSNDSR